MKSMMAFLENPAAPRLGVGAAHQPLQALPGTEVIASNKLDN
jgi:hypothetical protein